MIGNVWITVNRTCNLRCKWCYAKSTKCNTEDIMPLNLAKELINFSKTISAKSITLIGGEPTIYPSIFELIKYVKTNGLRSTLVTNGYLLSDNNYLNKLKNMDLDTVGFSIKAANRQQQIDLTGIDCFEKIKKAMHNLSNSKGIKYAYSTVISKDTIDNIEEDDFKDKESFEKFWQNNEVVKLYDKIYEYPDITCQTCKKYLRCAGGYAVKWFSYKGLPKREENFHVKA